MTDYAKAFVDQLVAAGGIGTFGTDLFVGGLPKAPFDAVSVIQSGGKVPSPKWSIDYPSIQCLVRGGANNYTAAQTKAQAIKNAMLGFVSANVGGDRWVAVNMIGDIQTLPRDENNCPMFSLNFSLIIQPAAAGNRIALP